jgi:hypothetical protein
VRPAWLDPLGLAALLLGFATAMYVVYRCYAAILAFLAAIGWR